MLVYAIYVLAIFGGIIGFWIAYSIIKDKIKSYKYNRSGFKTAKYKGENFKLSLDIGEGWSDYDHKEIIIDVYSKYGGHEDTIKIPEGEWRGFFK